MSRLPQAPLVVLASAFALAANAAEFSPRLEEQPAPANALETPAAPRAISAALADKLAASAPKYVAPAFPRPKAEPSSGGHESDKPRNGIVRLPSYLVQEERLPRFKERDLLTPAGKLQLAYARHPGLHFGNLWIFRNDAIALAMLEEELRLERMKEFYDLASLLPGEEGKKAKALADQAFARGEFSSTH